MEQPCSLSSARVLALVVLLVASNLYGFDNALVAETPAASGNDDRRNSVTTILYVDPQNPNCGENSGNGSEQLPFCTIQRAYYFAPDGAQIRVKPGIYNKCLFLYDIVTEKTVHVFADAWVNGGDNTATIVDGTGVRDCTFPLSGFDAAVVNIGGHGSEFVGFTVRGGRASGVLAVGSVAITNNVIRDNQSNYGAGIYAYSANCYYGDTNLQITNNTVTNNTASGLGGGISIAAGLSGAVGNPGCALSGDATVTVEGNVVTNNAAEANGGGIAVTTFTDHQHSASVVITQNTITDNQASTDVSIGYGGGIYGLTYGYGSESIHLIDNTISGNTTRDYGGGLSMAIFNDFNSVDLDHEIRVEANNVTGNQAGLGGGGIDLFVTTVLLSELQGVRTHILRNTVSGNMLTTDNPESTGGGGGILAISQSFGSVSPNIEFLLEHNVVVDNSAFAFGGGISLFASADAEPFNDGYIFPAKVEFEVRNNWITGNDASTNAPGFDGAGAGVFVLLEAESDALARVDMPLNTIAYNTLDNNTESGGIHAESLTRLDSGGFSDGHVELRLDSSIVSDNDGIGLGGPLPGQVGIITPGGTGEFAVGVTYNDFFGNVAGDVDGWIVLLEGNIFENPLFVGPPEDIHLGFGSPAIDSGNPQILTGDATTDIDGDPRVLDGNSDGNERVDMGADEFVNRALAIGVDIKPGSFPNRVNPRSRGVIPVALLGSEALDTTTIDPSSLRFGPDGAPTAHDLTKPLTFDDHLEDVNLDGYVDLVTHYRTREAGLTCAEEPMVMRLTGETVDGQQFEGTDAIETVGCRGSGDRGLTSRWDDLPTTDTGGIRDIERR